MKYYLNEYDIMIIHKNINQSNIKSVFKCSN